MYRIIGADGKEYGPISAGQLRQWIAEGRANAATPVLTEGATEWKTLGSLPEFSLSFTGTTPAGAPPTFATGPAYPHKTSALATASLVLGIISLLFALCCCCCYGLPFNVTGLVFSLIALGQIQSHPERYGGKGMAIAGLVLCVISLVLAVIMIILYGLTTAFNQPTHHVYRL